MNTIGWIFLLVGALVFREVSKGRSITDMPKDLGDAFIALVTNNQHELANVLSRTGNTNSVDAAPADTQGSQLPGANGTALLAEMKRLGAAATGGYQWGATGPNAYDCSGIVWRAMKNLGIYNGPRFTTFTFPAVSAASGFADTVTTPQVGDVVLWITGHMGVVDGPGTFYSALSKRSGIKSVPISAIDAQRGAHRFYRIIDTGKLLGINGGTGRVKPQPGTGSANAAEHDNRLNDPTDYGAQLFGQSSKS